MNKFSSSVVFSLVIAASSSVACVDRDTPTPTENVGTTVATGMPDVGSPDTQPATEVGSEATVANDAATDTGSADAASDSPATDSGAEAPPEAAPVAPKLTVMSSATFDTSGAVTHLAGGPKGFAVVMEGSDSAQLATFDLTGKQLHPVANLPDSSQGARAVAARADGSYRVQVVNYNATSFAWSMNAYSVTADGSSISPINDDWTRYGMKTIDGRVWSAGMWFQEGDAVNTFIEFDSEQSDYSFPSQFKAQASDLGGQDVITNWEMSKIGDVYALGVNWGLSCKNVGEPGVGTTDTASLLIFDGVSSKHADLASYVLTDAQRNSCEIPNYFSRVMRVNGQFLVMMSEERNGTSVASLNYVNTDATRGVWYDMPGLVDAVEFGDLGIVTLEYSLDGTLKMLLRASDMSIIDSVVLDGYSGLNSRSLAVGGGGVIGAYLYDTGGMHVTFKTIMFK